MNIYRDSGNAAEILAGVDLMWEKYQQGEECVAIQNLSFEKYDGAVVYAARTPLEEANPDISKAEYNFDVLRRSTGGSAVVFRPNDIVITASRPNSSEDLLEDYLGPVLIESLKELGVDEEFRIRSDHNRRALWVDGKPISSFSSREKDSGFLSGMVFVEPYKTDRISDVIDLRPGEEDYINEMSAISDYANPRDLSEIMAQNLEAEQRTLAGFENLLEAKAEDYRGSISDANGSRHRGFCPIYKDDLEQFRKNYLENFQ